VYAAHSLVALWELPTMSRAEQQASQSLRLLRQIAASSEQGQVTGLIELEASEANCCPL